MVKSTILVYDSLIPKGHKYVSYKILELLSNHHNLIVVNKNGYYDDLNLKNTEVLNPFLFKNTNYSIVNIFINIVNVLMSIACGFKYRKNKMLFLSFNTSAFLIYQLFFLGTKSYLIHHNNTDELNNSAKKFFFNLYKNKVHHIVFASFIKSYLEAKINVSEKLIHVLKHPIKEVNTDFGVDKKEIIAISSSNDEVFIQKIVDYEEKNEFFLKSNIVFKIKSKNINYSNGCLTVFNNYLNEEEYLEAYKRCYAIVLLFPKTYKYRFSGTILDALSQQKKIIGANIPIMQHFSKIVPESCMMFKDIDEMFNCIQLTLNSDSADEKLAKLMEGYKDHHIEKELSNIFKNKD